MLAAQSKTQTSSLPVVRARGIRPLVTAQEGLAHFSAQTRLAQRFLRKHKELQGQVIQAVERHFESLERGACKVLYLPNNVTIRARSTGKIKGKRGGLRLSVEVADNIFFLRVRPDEIFFPIESIPIAYKAINSFLRSKNFSLKGMRVQLLQPHLLHKENGFTYMVTDFLKKDDVVLVKGSARALGTERIKRIRAALNEIIRNTPPELRGGLSANNAFFAPRTNTLLLFDIQPGDGHDGLIPPKPPKPRLVRH